jgi:hypothetical protein
LSPEKRALVKAIFSPSGDQSAPNSSIRPVFLRFLVPVPAASMTKRSESPVLLLNFVKPIS